MNCFGCNNLADIGDTWECGGEEIDPEKIDAEMCPDSDLREEA